MSGVTRLETGSAVSRPLNWMDRIHTRHEFPYGRLTRSLPLSDGASTDDVTARYDDGILEIRIPIAAPAAAPDPKKITVSKA